MACVLRQRRRGRLAIAAQVLDVKLDSNSGLTFGAANGLKSCRLWVSRLRPGTVTAVGHSHGAIASAAPGQATSLLKTNDEGHFTQLRSFSVGSAVTRNRRSKSCHLTRRG